MARLFQKQDGNFSIIGIWTVLAVSLLTLMLYSLAQAEIRMAVNFREGIQAQFTAEAGTKYAVYKLTENPGWHPTTDGYPATVALPSVVGKYTITITELPDQIILIQTIGQVNQARRKVSARFSIDKKAIEMWDSY